MITTLITPNDNIESRPSVQDNLFFIAQSDNSASVDFKYVFDVFVNNVQLVRTKIYPEPNNLNGYFDASQVLRNEIQYDWFRPLPIDANTLTTAKPNETNQIAVTYDLYVGEDVSAVTTLNLASATCKAYNCVPSLFGRSPNEQIYSTPFFTTSKPSIRNAIKSNPILIGAYIPDNYNTELLRFRTRTYESDNSIIDIYDKLISDNDINHHFYQYDFSLGSLQQFYNDVTLSYDNIKYYEVELQYFDIDEIDPQRAWKRLLLQRIYLNCYPKYTTIPLYFINKYGMFDTAFFQLSNKLTFDIERKAFEQRDYNYGINSVDYFTSVDNVNVYNETKINFSNKINWTYKLTMDTPTDTEFEWLSELMYSPQIYARIDNDFYPITIKGTNYEYSKYQNNGLKPFEVEIDVNQKRYGFRR